MSLFDAGDFFDDVRKCVFTGGLLRDSAVFSFGVVESV